MIIYIILYIIFALIAVNIAKAWLDLDFVSTSNNFLSLVMGAFWPLVLVFILLSNINKILCWPGTLIAKKLKEIK